MKLKYVLMELLLAAFDRFMDWVTFGEWTRVCGDVIPNVKSTRR